MEKWIALSPWTTLWILILSVANILALVFTAFFRGYGTKRGEDFATKENLKDAIEQVRQETQAAKEAEIAAIQGKLDIVVAQNDRLVRSSEQIKDEISSRQRIWELRREVAYDLIKTLGTLSHLFPDLGSAWFAFRGITSATEEKNKAYNNVIRLQDKFKAGVETLWQLQGVASLLFDDTVVLKITDAINGANGLFASANSKTDEEKKVGLRPFLEARMELTTLLQKELTRNSENKKSN
jgi:DNA-binding cell septation regulator SpoVG